MIHFYPIILLLSLGLTIQATPYVLHEKRVHIPSGWKLAHRYSPIARFPLRFGLRQENIDQLDELLMAVADPSSPDYGRHWSAERVAHRFAPSNESVAAVTTWLHAQGIPPALLLFAPGRSWVEAEVTVAHAERLLSTQYNVYAHTTGAEHVACESYSLPAHIAPHVELVTPSIHFDAVLRRRAGVVVQNPARKVGRPGAGGSTPKTTGTFHTIFHDPELEHCDTQTTPACLRALYSLYHQASACGENSIGIVEYTPQAYLQSDLDMFNRNFSSALVGKSPTLVSIDGGVDQHFQEEFDYNGESNLDLQYAMNLVNLFGDKQNVTLYQVGDIPQGGSFNNLLDALDGSYCTFEGGDDPEQDGVYPDSQYYPNGFNGKSCGIIKPANVISTSYGYNEADLSSFYTARQCNEYGKLGLMGVTVIYSSGDNGVGGNEDLCLNADGSQTPDGPIFNPTFPSTCPYVTSIGATQVTPGARITSRNSEGACEQVIFSGGGFSNHFAVPAYQKAAAERYMQNYKPDYAADVWNSTGSRGYPDMSANGANYVVAVDGQFSRVFGTSASAPVVASILSMVNDARLTIGKGTIGFINPVIYSDFFFGAFNDITLGGNEGCGTKGFTAVTGWDPVTGLGTPNFSKLFERWLLLP